MVRYTLFQIPALGVVVILAVLFHELAGLSVLWCAAAVALWLVKDVAMYPIVRDAYQQSAPTGAETLVGREGVVLESIGEAGYVRLGAERWRAVPEQNGSEIAAGDRVRVVGLDGSALVVRRL